MFCRPTTDAAFLHTVLHACAGPFADMATPQSALKPLFGLSKGPTGVFKSVLDTTRTDGKRRDEIYVDVIERLSVTFNAAGNPVSSQIDGSIQVRLGSPEVMAPGKHSQAAQGLASRGLGCNISCAVSNTVLPHLPFVR